nr:hypothetical protein [Tanacetum cinerariifolium]
NNDVERDISRQAGNKKALKEIYKSDELSHGEELDLWECFCKYVRFLIFSTYEFDLYVFSFNAFSYEVVLRVNIFTSSMKYGVLRAIADLLSTLIVTFSSLECVSLLSSLFNHNACVAAVVVAMNSDSHDDSATVACFCVLQLIGDSP